MRVMLAQNVTLCNDICFRCVSKSTLLSSWLLPSVLDVVKMFGKLFCFAHIFSWTSYSIYHRKWLNPEWKKSPLRLVLYWSRFDDGNTTITSLIMTTCFQSDVHLYAFLHSPYLLLKHCNRFTLCSIEIVCIMRRERWTKRVVNGWIMHFLICECMWFSITCVKIEIFQLSVNSFYI